MSGGCGRRGPVWMREVGRSVCRRSGAPQLAAPLGGVPRWEAFPEVNRALVTCGVPELGHCLGPGLLRSPVVLIDEAAEDGMAFDPLLGEVGGGMVGPGRAELAAAVGPPPVVMSLVLSQDEPQMSFAEDEYRSVTSVRAVSTNRSAK